MEKQKTERAGVGGRKCFSAAGSTLAGDHHADRNRAYGPAGNGRWKRGNTTQVVPSIPADRAADRACRNGLVSSPCAGMFQQAYDAIRAKAWRCAAAATTIQCQNLVGKLPFKGRDPSQLAVDPKTTRSCGLRRGPRIVAPYRNESLSCIL